MWLATITGPNSTPLRPLPEAMETCNRQQAVHCVSMCRAIFGPLRKKSSPSRGQSDASAAAPKHRKMFSPQDTHRAWVPCAGDLVVLWKIHSISRKFNKKIRYHDTVRTASGRQAPVLDGQSPVSGTRPNWGARRFNRARSVRNVSVSVHLLLSEARSRQPNRSCDVCARVYSDGFKTKPRLQLPRCFPRLEHTPIPAASQRLPWPSVRTDLRA